MPMFFKIGTSYLGIIKSFKRTNSTLLSSRIQKVDDQLRQKKFSFTVKTANHILPKLEIAIQCQMFVGGENISSIQKMNTNTNTDALYESQTNICDDAINILKDQFEKHGYAEIGQSKNEAVDIVLCIIIYIIFYIFCFVVIYSLININGHGIPRDP